MVLFSQYIYDKIFLQNYYRNIWSFLLLFSLTINLYFGKSLEDPQIDVTVVFVVIFILVVLLVAVAVVVVFVLSKRKTLGLAYPYPPPHPGHSLTPKPQNGACHQVSKCVPLTMVQTSATAFNL